MTLDFRLKLSRPIVFFDLETTGIDQHNDRIIQIGAIKFFPNGKKEEYNRLVNPNIPIPKESSAVHGITDEMVRDKPSLGDLAEELSELFYSSDLGGFNIKYYDIPMLQKEFARVGLELNLENVKIVDSMMIFKLKEPRTLAVAYEKYCDKTLDNAHDAMSDIRASIEVLEGQLKYYNDIPDSPEKIHEYCFPFNPDAYDSEAKLRYVDGELTINFGKNKGKTLKSLATTDPSYLTWILNGNFSEKVKKAVREILS